MDLRILPLGRIIAAQPGANLLDTLRQHDVPISYSCMAGRCGLCRCTVDAGRVLASGGDIRQPSHGQGGQVLACQSTLTEPCAITIPEPDEVVVHPARVLKASVAAIRQETHDIRTLLLKPAKPLSHAPGQYATLQFSPDHIRPYSMAGIAGDEMLEFHIRLVPGGRVSPYVFDTLKEGDTVRVSGPMGASYLRRNHDGPMLCIAGGTGLAPVLSIIRGAFAAGMDNPIHLYFGVRTLKDLYGLDRLYDLAAAHRHLVIHPVIAHGEAAAGMRQGLVTDAVAQDWSSLEGFRAYLCGAPAMVEAATMAVHRLGLPLDRIYADAFYSSAV